MKPRILIAEDETIVARDIHQQLVEMHYEPVGHATRADEAITLAGQLRPDLVLMDVQLADGTDGIAAANSIREQFNVPVVFLTAFASEDTIARALYTKHFGYIVKPFSERELWTVVEMALYKHKAEVRLSESAEHIKAIVDNIADGVVTIDEQGVIQSFNKAAVIIFGYSQQETVGQHVSMLMSEQHFGQNQTYLDVLRATGEAKIIEKPRDLLAQRNDGSHFSMNLSVSQISRGGKYNLCRNNPRHLGGQAHRTGSL